MNIFSTTSHSKQTGAAMLLFVLFFSVAATAMLFMLGTALFADTSDFTKIARSKQAMLSADAAVEDMVYRVVNGMVFDTTEQITLQGVTGVATSSYDTSSSQYTITGESDYVDVIRRSEAVVAIASVNIEFGVLAGTGGFSMSNNSDVYGDVYSNGQIVGANSAEVHGDAVSAGSTGLLDGINVHGDAYSHTINAINADSDAYYTVEASASTVWGTRHTPAPDQPFIPLPIAPETIQDWKDFIISDGTVIAAADPECSSGEYVIETNITMGNIKIECDVTIRKQGSATVVQITGPVWIEGNLRFEQGPEIRVDSSLNEYSAQFIVDDESNRITSSQIEIRNATDFYGSGDVRSYVLLLSMNESESLGGSEYAVDISQSAVGKVVTYAADGLINTNNSVDLVAAVGHRIDLSNGASVTYDANVSNLLFPPTGAPLYEIQEWGQVE